MPFKSEKQRRYLWANEPEVAQRWSDKYGSKPMKRNRDEGRGRAQPINPNPRSRDEGRGRAHSKNGGRSQRRRKPGNPTTNWDSKGTLKFNK